MELSVAEVQLKGRGHFVGFIRDLKQREAGERLLHEVQAKMFHMSCLSSIGEWRRRSSMNSIDGFSAVSNYLQGARRLIDSIDIEQVAKLKGELNTLPSGRCGQGDWAALSRANGAFDFTEKPYDADFLLAAVRAALEFREGSESSENSASATDGLDRFD